jgi:hypothetical protein
MGHELARDFPEATKRIDDAFAQLAMDAEDKVKPENLQVEPVRSPPSSDMAEFEIIGDKIHIYCLICARTLDDVNYLNEAILVWRNHQASVRVHLKKKEASDG